MSELPLTWWIQVVELPALGGLFFWMKSTRNETDTTRENMRKTLEERIEKTREAVSLHRVEIAKQYASIDSIRDLEKRLTDHLIRIEEKLETRQQRMKK